MDFIVNRGNVSDDAEKFIDFCVEKSVISCIAAHTIPNLHFILRKHLTREQRNDILLEVCGMFTVVGIDANKLISALQNEDFTDFEDCLQAECAAEFKADYIVTRNTKDFRGSAVPALEPLEFINKFE
jgi:predicted nucleic acid-binding protein